MDFSYSPKVVDLQKRLTAFMELVTREALSQP